MISDKLVNHRWHLLIGGRVSSEGNVSQKNAKIFANFCSYFAKVSSKFRNFCNMFRSLKPLHPVIIGVMSDSQVYPKFC